MFHYIHLINGRRMSHLHNELRHQTNTKASFCMRLDLELFLQATGLIVSIWVFQRLLNIYVHVVASILPICPLSP